MSPKIIAPWSTQSISLLIENYSQFPCLYDTKLQIYHNKHIRQKSLEEIASALQPYRPNTTLQEVKTKISSLRTQFGVEHNKVKASLKSGAGTDNIYVPSLWYYNEMLFLQKHITPRKSIETTVSQLKEKSKQQQSNLFDDVVNEHDDESLFITVSADGLEEMYTPEDNLTKYSGEESYLVEEMEKKSPKQKLSAPLWLSEDMPSTKKKKVTIDSTLKKSEEALSNIAKALSTPPVSSPKPINASQSLAQFISASLESINNPSLKIETTQNILNVLMDAQLKDLC